MRWADDTGKEERGGRQGFEGPVGKPHEAFLRTEKAFRVQLITRGRGVLPPRFPRTMRDATPLEGADGRGATRPDLGDLTRVAPGPCLDPRQAGS